MDICPSCGSSNMDDSGYCRNCGNFLRENSMPNGEAKRARSQMAYVIWTTFPFTIRERSSLTKMEYVLIWGTVEAVVGLAFAMGFLVLVLPSWERGEAEAAANGVVLTLMGVAMTGFFGLWWWVGRKGAIEEEEKQKLEENLGFAERPRS